MWLDSSHAFGIFEATPDVALSLCKTKMSDGILDLYRKAMPQMVEEMVKKGMCSSFS